MKAVRHPHQRLRLGETDTLTCIDPATSRLLKYHEIGGRGGNVKVDAAFFSERDNIQVGACVSIAS